MKLQNMEFIELLPRFMQDDAANVGLSRGIDAIVKMFAAYGKHLSTWAAIDELTEAELDELAWEKNVTWYEHSADIETKRKIIKDSDEVKKQLGTGWAVERVVRAYFGEGYIEEWFEYGGEPGRFKVVSSNPSITQDELDKFLRILERVKRKSAHLENVSIGLTGRGDVRMGIGRHESEKVTIRAKRGAIEGWRADQLAGIGAHESETWRIAPAHTERGE